MRCVVDSRDRTRGYLAVVLAAVVFGVWPSLSKLVLTEGVHPLVIGFLVQLVPAIVLLPTIRRVRISRKDWRLIVLGSLSGSVGGPILYFYGLELTTASNAVLLSNSESFFTIILAYAFLAERATGREYVALGGIAIGAFLVTTQLRFGDVQFIEFFIGNAMLVAAASCWAVSNVVSTTLVRRIPIVPLLDLQLVIASVAFAPILLVTGTPLDVPLPVVPLVILLSFIAVGAFSLLFLYAVRKIGAMRTGAVLPTSALWGLLLALYLFPNEVLSGVQLLGGGLMIGSLVGFYVLRGPTPSDTSGETLKPEASDGPNSR
ncbi:MAG: DMT family transporter [Thermoplasmata archaeon]|nr:DMT family transporter [Thermoplasmata archaeon]